MHRIQTKQHVWKDKFTRKRCHVTVRCWPAERCATAVSTSYTAPPLQTPLDCLLSVLMCIYNRAGGRAALHRPELEQLRTLLEEESSAPRWMDKDGLQMGVRHSSKGSCTTQSWTVPEGSAHSEASSTCGNMATAAQLGAAGPGSSGVVNVGVPVSHVPIIHEHCRASGCQGTASALGSRYSSTRSELTLTPPQTSSCVPVHSRHRNVCGFWRWRLSKTPLVSGVGV